MADKQAKIVLAAEDRTARVFAGLRSNLGVVQRQVDGAKQSFASLGPAIVGAFGVAGISAFFGKVVNGIDKLNDLADATGSSVEKLSGLEDIGARTGTSIDTVGDAVLKLNKNLLEAQDPTSTAAGLFKQLGLNVQELSKLDPSEALLRVATALNGFEQNANKGQFQVALLGKSTRELSSFLKDLAEAGTISATVLGDQGDEADKFNKQLFQIQKNSTDAARALALELLPSINNLFYAYKQFGGVGGIVGAIFGQDATSQARATVDAVQAEIKRAQDSIERMSTELERDPANEFLKVRIDKARDRLALLLRESVLATDALKDAANRLAPPAAGSSADPAKPDIGNTGGGGKGGGGAKTRLSDAQQYLENLQRQLQSTQDLSVAETVLADIQAGRLKLAKGESAAPLLAIAQEIDQAKRRQDQLQVEAEQVRELRSETERLRSAGASVFEATRTSAEKFGIELGNIQELLQKGAIDSDTYYRRVAQLREEFDKVSAEKDTFTQLDSFAQRASQNIQDALGDELSNVLDGNFKNIGDSFTKLLNRMVAEAAAQEISRALFGEPTKGAGGSGGDGGLLGGLFKEGGKALGKFGSSLFSSFSGGAATGTNLLERDMITLVHKGEAIVPKAYNPAAGGVGGRSVVVNNTFNVSGAVDRATQGQIAADAGRAIQLALSRNG